MRLLNGFYVLGVNLTNLIYFDSSAATPFIYVSDLLVFVILEPSLTWEKHFDVKMNKTLNN